MPAARRKAAGAAEKVLRFRATDGEEATILVAAARAKQDLSAFLRDAALAAAGAPPANRVVGDTEEEAERLFGRGDKLLDLAEQVLTDATKRRPLTPDEAAAGRKPDADGLVAGYLSVKQIEGTANVLTSLRQCLELLAKLRGDIAPTQVQAFIMDSPAMRDLLARIVRHCGDILAERLGPVEGSAAREELARRVETERAAAMAASGPVGGRGRGRGTVGLLGATAGV